MQRPGAGATALGLTVWLGLATAAARGELLPPPQTPHDRSFWSHIVESDFAVPVGTSAFELIVELNDVLGDPDPELRNTDYPEGAGRRDWPESLSSQATGFMHQRHDFRLGRPRTIDRPRRGSKDVRLGRPMSA